MAETNSDRVINLSELSPNLKPKDIIWTGAFAGVDVKGSDAEEILQAFSKTSNMECWRKAALPARLQFGAHRRIPEVFCLAKLGWTIIANSNAKIIAGQHGYDPEDPDMGAIFIAYGPRIKSMKLGSLRNTEIYGLLCALIGIDPEKEAFSGDLNRVVLAN
jgi:predicted AlkP superfamily pyrophosphatase or phosphodiesterase